MPDYDAVFVSPGQGAVAMGWRDRRLRSARPRATRGQSLPAVILDPGAECRGLLRLTGLSRRRGLGRRTANRLPAAATPKRDTRACRVGIEHVFE